MIIRYSVEYPPEDVYPDDDGDYVYYDDVKQEIADLKEHLRVALRSRCDNDSCSSCSELNPWDMNDGQPTHWDNASVTVQALENAYKAIEE